jgi:hypothetical protein
VRGDLVVGEAGDDKCEDLALAGCELLAASDAPFWIAGWILLLALIIGLATYYTRRRRGRDPHRPE